MRNRRLTNSGGPVASYELFRNVGRCGVDAEQMKLAEGYDIPYHLSELLAGAKRTMELSGVRH